MPLNSFISDTVELLIAVWWFAFGAAVGSFLNVVLYRLPAGKSLVRPASHCPVCSHPIRWYDNVPIVSWVVLRGHCRDCRAPISLRYPAVEALTAALFLVLGVREFLQGGANLPWLRTDSAPTSIELLAVAGGHLVLTCTLLCAWLIEADKRLVPARLFVPSLVVGLATPILLPNSHLVAAWSGLQGRWPTPLSVAIGGLAGLLIGWLCGRLLPPKQRRGLVGGAGCVGVVLGWQAVVVVALAAVAIYFALAAGPRSIRGKSNPPATLWLAAGTIAWILAWAQIVAAAGRLG